MEKIAETYELYYYNIPEQFWEYLANKFIDNCKIKYECKEDFYRDVKQYIDNNLNSIDLQTAKDWKLFDVYIKSKRFNSITIMEPEICCYKFFERLYETKFHTYFNCIEYNFPPNFIPPTA